MGKINFSSYISSVFDCWPLVVGKYFLVEVGFTTMNAFIPPYRSVRYHLKESSGKPPTKLKELFNLRHSMLNSRVEQAFTILTNCFKILTLHLFMPFNTHVKLVLVCCIIYNYIVGVDPNNKILIEGSSQQQELLVSS